MTDNNIKKHRFIRSHWILFVFILILVILAALTGWLDDSLYQNNPADLIIKFKFYDLSLLIFAIPASIIVLILSVKNNRRARIFSLGLTVYIVFSFGVSLFAYGRNSLFLIYIAILGLCAFYFTKGFSEIYNTTSFRIDNKISKIASIVLLFSAVSGFGYWLTDAISSLLPQSDEIDKLHVKVPQVFDMAFVLPFTIYGAIRLLRNIKEGILISLITMIFFTFIGLSVIIMETGFSAYTKTEMDYGKVYSYSFISIINLIITILAYRKLKLKEYFDVRS
jgi:hypothetical protein